VARTRRSSGDAEQPEIHRGLANVFFDRTRITSIDGRAGELRHRGYSIHELAERASFEEMAHLLIQGRLPGRAELDAFDAALRAARGVPAPVGEILQRLAQAHPMDALRTGVSALAAFDPDRDDDSREALVRKGTRLVAGIPTLIAVHHALRTGREPVAPSPTLPHAANLLFMLTGKPPSEREARVLDTDLVLHADHGANASTFVARVVRGTRSDLHAAVTAAIAAFAGPLHGGAVEGVMEMLEEIGEPGRVDAVLRERRARRQPVMGFGHRVYRTEDPRARHLRQLARELSEESGEGEAFAILDRLVEAMRPYARHGVDVNVDFYAGALYRMLRLPRDLTVPLFAAGRIAGWVAQVLEQDERNILIRPRLAYEGPEAPAWVPIEER